MVDLDLPYRLIAAGEEPLGERANVHNKMKTLRGIIDSLEDSKIKLIRDSRLGGCWIFLTNRHGQRLSGSSCLGDS